MTIKKFSGKINDVLTQPSPTGKIGFIVAGNAGLFGGGIRKNQYIEDYIWHVQEEAVFQLYVDHLFSIYSDLNLVTEIMNDWIRIHSENYGLDSNNIFKQQPGVSVDNIKFYEYVKKATIVVNWNNKPTIVKLYIICAPNASTEGTSNGTMAKSRSNKAEKDYDFFKKSISTAYTSALTMMQGDGITDIFLTKVGAGVYAGPHKAKINNDYSTNQIIKIPSNYTPSLYLVDPLAPITGPNPPITGPNPPIIQPTKCINHLFSELESMNPTIKGKPRYLFDRIREANTSGVSTTWNANKYILKKINNEFFRIDNLTNEQLKINIPEDLYNYFGQTGGKFRFIKLKIR